MNKSVINGYRLQPGPAQQAPPKGIIAGRIVPVAPVPVEVRRALTALAALVLPLLAVGVVVYAAQTTQPVPVLAMPSPAVVERVIEATPVVVERVVRVEASPIVVVVTATPMPARPVQSAPAAPVAPAPQTQPARQTAPTPAPERPVQASIVAPPVGNASANGDDWRPSDLWSPRPFRCADGSLWPVGGWGYLIEPAGLNGPWRVVEDNGARHTGCRREG